MRSSYCEVCRNKIPKERYSSGAVTCSTRCRGKICSSRWKEIIGRRAASCQFCRKPTTRNDLKRGLCLDCIDIVRDRALQVQIPLGLDAALRDRAEAKGMSYHYFIYKMLLKESKK